MLDVGRYANGALTGAAMAGIVTGILYVAPTTIKEIMTSSAKGGTIAGSLSLMVPPVVAGIVALCKQRRAARRLGSEFLLDRSDTLKAVVGIVVGVASIAILFSLLITQHWGP